MKTNRFPEALSLGALQTGEKGLVLQMGGGYHLICRMASIGITPGAELIMLVNPGRGSLIVQVRHARIALGRGEADKILIRRVVQR